MDRKTLFYVALSFRAHYVQFFQVCAELRALRVEPVQTTTWCFWHRKVLVVDGGMRNVSTACCNGWWATENLRDVHLAMFSLFWWWGMNGACHWEKMNWAEGCCDVALTLFEDENPTEMVQSETMGEIFESEWNERIFLLHAERHKTLLWSGVVDCKDCLF